MQFLYAHSLFQKGATFFWYVDFGSIVLQLYKLIESYLPSSTTTTESLVLIMVAPLSF